MKKLKIFVCCLSLILITAFCFSLINPSITSYAAEDTDAIKLSITGSYSTSIKADTAEVHAIIEAIGQDELTAKEDAFSKFEKIKNYLVDAGIAEDKINVTYFNTNTSQNNTYTGNIVCYYSVLNYSFTTNDMDNLDSTLSLLLDNGTQSISYINFSSSASYDVYQQSLKEALNVAIENAKNILSKESVQTYRIKEKSCYYEPVLYRNFADLSSMNQDVDITATVEIICG
ncbi:MAG TPA: SIMPL domain-containing protein [Candidatus Onthoplasma faecigallinarum]|nr:SIMPL domain-containing protein [Candidatus Onthoplasma faecigallinarum]